MPGGLTLGFAVHLVLLFLHHTVCVVILVWPWQVYHAERLPLFPTRWH